MRRPSTYQLAILSRPRSLQLSSDRSSRPPNEPSYSPARTPTNPVAMMDISAASPLRREPCHQRIQDARSDMLRELTEVLGICQRRMPERGLFLHPQRLLLPIPLTLFPIRRVSGGLPWRRFLR